VKTPSNYASLASIVSKYAKTLLESIIFTLGSLEFKGQRKMKRLRHCTKKDGAEKQVQCTLDVYSCRTKPNGVKV